MAFVIVCVIAIAIGQVSVIIYVWTRRDPQQTVSVFGFQFRSQYLPFVLLLFHLLIGAMDAVFQDLLGIAVGHLYWFLIEIVPQEVSHTHILQLIVNVIVIVIA